MGNVSMSLRGNVLYQHQYFASHTLFIPWEDMEVLFWTKDLAKGVVL